MDPERLAHFRIVGRLGQGGMGIVYRAEDEKLRRTVALKVLPEAFAQDEERRKRFLREAQSAAALRHPNIATIHDVGEDAGRVYLAMELVEGPTLRERMDRGRLGVPEALRVARGIARGLARAHAKGIVHRDLKPDNVVLDAEADGEPKILDFGLAKLREERSPLGATLAEHGETASVLTEEGRLLGTPHYMSPEQAGGASGVDARSDVFSVGVLLYEMLAGKRPFEAERLGELLARIERDPPASLRSLASDVPEPLAAIVERCLAKKPGDRYADAGSLGAALEPIVPMVDASAPNTTLASPKSLAGSEVSRVAGRLVRKKLWLGSLAGIAVASIAAAMAWQARSPRGGTAASAASTDAEDAGHGIAMTDYPPPTTNVPEAAIAYATGLKHVREAEGLYAGDEFIRACKLDPTMAAAGIRAVLYGADFVDTSTARQCYAQAVQNRAALDERGRMLLRLAEAAVSDPAIAPDETIARSRAVVDRFPRDAEACFLHARMLLDGGKLDEGRAALERTLLLDPQFALALQRLAMTYFGRDYGKVLELLDRCLEISPSAGTCLRTRSEVYVDEGRCADLESDARRLSVIEPTGRRSFEMLALALAARGAPLDGIAQMLAKRVPFESDDRSRRIAQIQNDTWLATLAGDLDAAERGARAWDAVYADSVIADDHAGPLLYLMDVLLEEGDVRKQLAFAEEVDHRKSAWTGSFLGEHAMAELFIRFHAGRIDEATFRRQRDEVSKKAGWDAHAFREWWVPYAEFVTTPEEASEGLSMLPDTGVGEDMNTLFQAKTLGHDYLLAGRAQEALPYLRAGAGSCRVLTWSQTVRAYPVTWMQAHAELGQALEQTGDTPRACDAYRVVLERWKNAKPRSVSLEKAKERSKALGCK